jgi:invasion protein IalB
MILSIPCSRGGSVRISKFAGLAIIALAMIGSGGASQAQQTLQGDLAAQIRLQGFACDKALGAVQDKKRSRPDHGVWTLRCSNATYRVSRAPDMAAKVEPLK